MLLMFGSDLLVDPYRLLLLAACLIYPLLAHKLRHRCFVSAAAVQWSMMIDALLAGLLIVASDYYLLALITFSSFVAYSTAMIAGFFIALIALGVVIGVVATGYLFYAPQAGVWSHGVNSMIDIGFAGAIVMYSTFVAHSVFRVTHKLIFSRKISASDQENLIRTTEQLRRYLSPQLFSALVAKPEVGVAKRKRLTLCFTDLSGFTELMDRLPEHEITEVLNEYLNAMATIALDYGGTVDKFMGDGLMIFFGDPHSQGARVDAVSCIKMARAMRSKLAELSVEWSERGLANTLEVRIGIHTGYCAVGNFGSENRMDYTAVGSAVNIASRMEAAAPNGEILVSESTLHLIRDQFDTARFATLQFKGIREPINCSLVRSPRSRSASGHDLKEKLLKTANGFHLEIDTAIADPKEVKRILLRSAEQLGGDKEAAKTSHSKVQLLR